MKKFADNLPIYLQLKAEVEDAILSGAIKPEESIKSIRILAAQYSINPLTVSKAINELEAEGTIYKRRGIGFFVSSDAQERLRRKHMQEYLDKDVKSFVRQAIRLGLTLKEITELITKTFEEEQNGTLPTVQ